MHARARRHASSCLPPTGWSWLGTPPTFPRPTFSLASPFPASLSLRTSDPNVSVAAAHCHRAHRHPLPLRRAPKLRLIAIAISVDARDAERPKRRPELFFNLRPPEIAFAAPPAPDRLRAR